MRKLLALFLILVPLNISAVIIDPTRTAITNWQNAGVVGGIPNRTTISRTLAAGSTSAQVTSAINSASTGTVVKLNAGVYLWTGRVTINKAITLRGAGADRPNFQAVSASSVAVGTGTKTFTVRAGLRYVVGETVRVTCRTAIANWMQGTVTSYSGTTLTLNITSTGGAEPSLHGWYTAPRPRSLSNPTLTSSCSGGREATLSPGMPVTPETQSMSRLGQRRTRPASRSLAAHHLRRENTWLSGT